MQQVTYSLTGISDIGNEGIKVKAADLLGATLVLEYRQQEFVVVHQYNRVEVYLSLADNKVLVGTVRQGSPFSGAIWKHGECIGEYAVDQTGNYQVTIVDHGFKRPEDSVRANPVVHLLQSLQS